MIGTVETHVVDWKITNPEPHILALTLIPRRDIVIGSAGNGIDGNGSADYLKLHFLGMRDLVHDIAIEEEDQDSSDWTATFSHSESHVRLAPKNGTLTLEAGVAYEGIRLNYKFRKEQNVSHRVLFHLQFFGIQVRNNVESHELDLMVFDTIPRHELELEILGPSAVFTDGKVNEIVVRLINRGPRSLIVHRSEAEVVDADASRYAFAELRLLHDDGKIYENNYTTPADQKGDNAEVHRYAYEDALLTTDHLQSVDVYLPDSAQSTLSVDMAKYLVQRQVSGSETFWRLELNPATEFVEIPSGHFLEFHLQGIASELLEGHTLIQVKMLTLVEDLYEYTYLTSLQRTPVRVSGNAADAKMRYGRKLTISSSWGNDFQVVLDEDKLTIDGKKSHELVSIRQTGEGNGLTVTTVKGHSAEFTGGDGVKIKGIRGVRHGLQIEGETNVDSPLVSVSQTGHGNSALFDGGDGVKIEGIRGVRHGLQIEGETNVDSPLVSVSQTGHGNSALFDGGDGVKIEGIRGVRHGLQIEGGTVKQASLVSIRQKGEGNGLTVTTDKGRSAEFTGGTGVSVEGVTGDRSALRISNDTNYPMLWAQQKGPGFAARFKGGNGVDIEGALHVSKKIYSPSITEANHDRQALWKEVNKLKDLEQRVSKNENDLKDLGENYNLLEATVHTIEDVVDGIKDIPGSIVDTINPF